MNQTLTTDRIERAVLNMSIAFLVSKRGTCLRARVGAVIVQDKRIVATGYNGAIIDGECRDNCDITKGCTHAIHAEANAIAFAAKMGISLLNSTLYCTHQPCYECAKLIIQAGIAQVYYCLPYRVTEGVALLNSKGVQYDKIPYEQIENYIKP